MSRRRHVVHEEEHENHERWLVTYADMITLLMVLFIVMFSMSQVDKVKFNALKAGLAAGFGQSTSVLDGSSSILEEPGTSAAEPINPNRVEDTPQVTELKVQAVSEAQALQNQRRYAEAAAEAESLLRVEKRVLTTLKRQGLVADVRTAVDGRGLAVSLVSRHVVFSANSASLSDRGRRILAALAPVLRDLPHDLQIEGHTNQAAGTPKFYASDWDLSSARAVTVLRFLDERLGLPEQRLAAVGYGHTKPLVDPGEPGSQELNKRVDIVVLSRLASDNEDLLDLVVDDRARAATAAPTTTTHANTSSPQGEHS